MKLLHEGLVNILVPVKHGLRGPQRKRETLRCDAKWKEAGGSHLHSISDAEVVSGLVKGEMGDKREGGAGRSLQTYPRALGLHACVMAGDRWGWQGLGGDLHAKSLSCGEGQTK